MINPTLLRAGIAVLVPVIVSACLDSTAPRQQVSEGQAAGGPRSGSLHVEKECSTFTGHAGDICTITSSTLAEISPGTRVIYARDAAGILLDTDVRLDPPGPGNNAAFGHCTVNLATGLGGCVFSGGTGKFTWFRAEVALTPLGGPNFAWNGTYRFSPRD
jgi:hypothetical protein